jgi:steroid delta-isomerase
MCDWGHVLCVASQVNLRGRNPAPGPISDAIIRRHHPRCDDGSVPIDQLVATYLNSLAAADSDSILSLFTPDATVNSPLYGSLGAADFYPRLFADTAESNLTLRATMVGEREGRPVVSFWFDFDWILANGEPAPFTVVDVAELDHDGRISQLHIVYDTAPIREAFDRQRAGAGAADFRHPG